MTVDPDRLPARAVEAAADAAYSTVSPTLRDDARAAVAAFLSALLEDDAAMTRAEDCLLVPREFRAALLAAVQEDR